jgi:hypothetical protein
MKTRNSIQRLVNYDDPLTKARMKKHAMLLTKKTKLQGMKEKKLMGNY